MKESVGPRSEALLKEVKALVDSCNETMEREQDLIRKVADHQETLDKARAQDLLGVVDKDQVRAFEAELDTLQNELALVRSTLAGLGHLLGQKREALAQAKETDILEAVSTKAMATALAGLRKNERALEKTRTAILQALESGAAALLGELSPHRETWGKLVMERESLYVQRYKALGENATLGDDAYRKMSRDGHVKLFSRNGQEPPQILELAELLHPLIASGRGRR